MEWITENTWPGCICHKQSINTSRRGYTMNIIFWFNEVVVGSWIRQHLNHPLLKSILPINVIWLSPGRSCWECLVIVGGLRFTVLYYVVCSCILITCLCQYMVWTDDRLLTNFCSGLYMYIIVIPNSNFMFHVK